MRLPKLLTRYFWSCRPHLTISRRPPTLAQADQSVTSRSGVLGRLGSDAGALLSRGARGSRGVWQKLYRRLVEFHGDTARDLAEFMGWLAAEKPEQVLDLDDDANFTHPDNLVQVAGTRSG
jgi:hypothetical protein